MTSPNPHKLAENYNNHPNIFLYQKNSRDTRWILKHTYAKDTDQLLITLKTIVLGANHDHPAILPVRKFYVNQNSQKGFEIYQKLPRMDHNLNHLLNNSRQTGNNIPEVKIITYFYTLLSGIEYLHRKKMPHGNLKASNILMNKNGEIKIADIGGVKSDDENLKSLSSESEDSSYLPPETFKKDIEKKSNKDLLYKRDMWSLGVIITELCLNELLNVKKEASKKLESLKERYSEGIIEMLTSLTSADPQERMTPKNAMKFLENKYSEICQKIKEGSSMNRLETIKREIEEKHKEIFEFDQKKNFALHAVTGTGITENSIDALVQDLKEKLQGDEEANLDQFEFNAASSQYITSLAVRNLTTYIGFHLRNLTQLKLDFPYCEQLGDQAVREVCHIGSNLKSLEDLSISFPWCKKITDQSLDKLTYHIGYTFQGLKALQLDFRNCPQITSKAIESLSRNFKNRLQKLQTLNLKFSGCELIDDEGIRAIQNFIGLSLPELKDLSLIFAICPKISLKAVKELCTHINLKSVNLQYLLLNFEGCKLLINELDLKQIQALKLELGFLKKVDLIFV